MQGNTELELDQLWYTFSKDGFGSMTAGYRVRAASPGLYNLQDRRYRLVDRFLPYTLPRGINPSEFNARIAPISLSFVNNGAENLLIRKVFVGRDFAGRNSVFFTHLIAGLPREFTARDAIHLWYCPELWVESEPEDKASNDTYLEKIPYSKILAYVQRSQTAFNFAPIQEPLQNLLLLILSRGLPPRSRVRGQSILIAALIYGLTHTLPLTLLPNLTFTTYESEAMEGESIVIVGTISGTELQDATRLRVQPELAGVPISPDIQRYVTTVITSLLTNNTTKLSRLIEEIERRDHATVEDLIELFKRRFRDGSLTTRQLEDIVLHSADNLDDLLDPGVQQEAAQLLLSQLDYWEQRGKKVFSDVASWLAPAAQARLNQQTQDALARFLNGLAEYILAAMQAEITQGTLPKHSTALLGVLAHPAMNPGIYQRMLPEFAEGRVYEQIISDEFWPFQIWLLRCAKLMQPQPSQEQMQPWLRIPSWGRLDKVLKLDLPAEWEYVAIYGVLTGERNIPRVAIPIVKVHEEKFTAFMRDHLRRGSQAKNKVYTDIVIRLFEAIIYWDEQEHSYPNRASLLLELVNAVPNDPRVIELLFSIVPFASPYQLTADEFDSVVVGCKPELITSSSASPSLMKYLQEYILFLTAKKLTNQNTMNLLVQIQKSNASSGQSGDFANLVKNWLAINQFLASSSFNRELLQAVKPALESLIPLLQQRQAELPQGAQDIRQMFLQEIVPHLVTLVHREYQLERVLEVFEDAKVASAWDLLSQMAAHAGEAQTKDLSRLTPYLLCGIREYVRAGLPPDALDRYLQALYGRVDEEVLKNVDIAVSSPLFPDEIKRQWRVWRKRRKPSFLENIKKLNTQQQKQTTDSQPVQVPANWPQTPATPPPPDQTGVMSPRSLGWGQPKDYSTKKLPETQEPIRSHWPKEPDKGLNTEIAIVSIRDQVYSIRFGFYQQLHLTFAQVLPYWSQVLSDQSVKVLTKGIMFEIGVIRSLLEELQRTPMIIISERLIQYYADSLLINLEVERHRQAGDWSAQQFFDPMNHISARLDEFRNFVGINAYQKLCESYTEKAIIDTLYWLILRYRFVQYMNAKKKDWEKWLKVERKQIRVEFQGGLIRE